MGDYFGMANAKRGDVCFKVKKKEHLLLFYVA